MRLEFRTAYEKFEQIAYDKVVQIAMDAVSNWMMVRVGVEVQTGIRWLSEWKIVSFEFVSHGRDTRLCVLEPMRYSRDIYHDLGRITRWGPVICRAGEDERYFNLFCVPASTEEVKQLPRREGRKGRRYVVVPE